jgi:hypothetical protein
LAKLRHNPDIAVFLLSDFFRFDGRGERIRTSDPLLPNQVKAIMETCWNLSILSAFDGMACGQHPESC